jgi:glycosyltransferase involved in cell wall biosynthesis
LSERRVLFMTYYVPPVAGVGVERTLKHATYLPEMGWRPVVVGPANPGYRLVDWDSLDRIPAGTEVHRAYALEPAHLRTMLSWLWRSATPGNRRAAFPHLEAGKESGASSARGGRLRQALNAGWAWLIPLTFFPDEQILWVPAAAAVAVAVHRTMPAHALYSSSPPISSHLATAVVKSVTGLPWIADFRDPWVGNAFNRQLPATYERLRESLERIIVRSADRSVFATESLRDVYAHRYPKMAERFVTITNGYDLSDVAITHRGTPQAAPPFRLVYTGTVYDARGLEIFLDGVERLVADKPVVRDELRIEFVGSLSPDTRRLVTERLPRLDPVVRYSGQVSRSEALIKAGAANAGLLLLASGPDRNLFVGVKLFDYLGLDLPVLALAPPGETRRILELLDWGVCADPTPEGVADGLARIMSAPPPNRLADPERRFERRGLTGRLAELLDGLVGRPA